MSDVFDRIADWLQKLAFFDGDVGGLVEHLSHRLIDGGVPVARVSLGRLMMHPVIGLVDATWDASTDRIDWTVMPRSSVTDDLFDKAPFGENTKLTANIATKFFQSDIWDLADGLVGEMEMMPVLRANLTDPSTRDKYPIYQKLAASGITDYLVFSVPFGKRSITFESGTQWVLGASVSFATKRRSGFTQREIDGLTRLSIPLFGTVHVFTEQFLAAELMEAYLGRISGRSVLNGQMSRGDVREIDCALLFSDMHGSTALSQRLSPGDYVAAVNRYFDCVAGAVHDHGGEVLKFVGDGLLAIFPFDGHRRLPEDMCEAALSAAREAFQRREEIEPENRTDFGIGLHMGAAIYGNVGTESRLDFTVTGTSVAMVSRLEGLTRSLDVPLLATSEFAELVTETRSTLGSHTLRGFDNGVEVFSFEPLV
ncbi:adenylate/guanylate cyclase domain-containing protein [Ruegeria profundi]|uniref:adenylate/guanylate cyclase domain-containing protein n=1 Tax=Ruegeria profundi TaxID=1685378 RepID=UPI001CD4EEB8|nr:adenylate/guanylate cyclase domain-containing protein [Ruegeria profundi]MCA0928818.1 adenylate/guanylate cyclase domain-containing protein [Ruegeria profundi]